MIYEVFGPFELPYREGIVLKGTRGVPPKKDMMAQLNDFWDKVENDHIGLSEACGCYVFSIRAAKGCKPWYIGKASKQSFRKECFTADKILKYKGVADSKHGTPLLHFIARMTDGNKFSMPSKTGAGHLDIDFLESELIRLGLERNADIINCQRTKMLKDIFVPGIFNPKPGKLHPAAQSLRDILLK